MIGPNTCDGNKLMICIYQYIYLIYCMHICILVWQHSLRETKSLKSLTITKKHVSPYVPFVMTSSTSWVTMRESPKTSKNKLMANWLRRHRTMLLNTSFFKIRIIFQGSPSNTQHLHPKMAEGFKMSSICSSHWGAISNPADISSDQVKILCRLREWRRSHQKKSMGFSRRTWRNPHQKWHYRR